MGEQAFHLCDLIAVAVNGGTSISCDLIVVAVKGGISFM